MTTDIDPTIVLLRQIIADNPDATRNELLRLFLDEIDPDYVPGDLMMSILREVIGMLQAESKGRRKGRG